MHAKCIPNSSNSPDSRQTAWSPLSPAEPAGHGHHAGCVLSQSLAGCLVGKIPTARLAGAFKWTFKTWAL